MAPRILHVKFVTTTKIRVRTSYGIGHLVILVFLLNRGNSVELWHHYTRYVRLYT